MPDTTTTNYEWTKPELGGSDDTWGVKINAVLDSIDAKVKEIEDSITVTVQDKLLPIGSIYLTDKTGNPATWLGFGTWVQVSLGRAIVGAGTADGIAWAIGEQKGSAAVALSVSNMPKHAHGKGNFAVNIYDAGNDFRMDLLRTEGNSTIIRNTQGLSVDNNGGGNAPRLQYTSEEETTRVSYNGTHGHATSISGSTSNAGSGSAHTNIQPSEARFVWKRTA